MYRIKITIFILVIVLFACIYLPLLVLLFPWRKKAGPLMLQIASKVCLVIFRVKVNHSDKNAYSILKKQKKTGVILISNHVSLLDIFLLSAVFRAVFVSKTEVKHYPVIGWIASLMGIIFLKRDSEEERHLIIRTIAEEAAGKIVAVFPQGTTSSLADPMPFRCGIFKTVELNSSIIMQPVNIHYETDKEIAWTGNQLLIENVKLVCNQKKIRAGLTMHKQVTSSDYENQTISEICKSVQNNVLNISR
ncbi:MAG: 1-acyl-sn-glycerol-3-phosphate acyltransferase [Spirochaetes bacterium]|nr:1-acyl-sn-glycerol-3-phosphate acyltransferase [Spirochaetota bacterium]